MTGGTEPATITTDSSSLSLALLAERIQHERELRQVHDAYEREIRVMGQEHEKETRELVTKLEGVAEVIKANVIEGRLEVLNNERARQEQDRGTFATRIETTLSFEALERATIRATESNSAAIADIVGARREEAGAASSRRGVQTFIAPNLQGLLLLLAGLAAAYLALNPQG